MDAAGRTRAGLLYGVAAYGCWGLVPLYFKQLQAGPKEIIAHRIVWTAVLMLLVLTVAGRWKESLAVCRKRKMVLMLGLSAYLVAANWYVYVLAATSGRITQASLGYFILPLVNAFIGIAFFRERIRPAQAIALGLAACGVVYMTVQQGEWPWIGVFLAVSFAMYGIVRKVTPVDGVLGLGIETVLLTPPALGLLFYWESQSGLVFGHTSRTEDIWIAASGVVTAIPLVCFAQAVRRVQLVTIGFLQYLSPSLQLMIALLVYGEPFGITQQISFGLIWIGLVVFAVDAVWKARINRSAGSAETSPSATPDPDPNTAETPT